MAVEQFQDLQIVTALVAGREECLQLRRAPLDLIASTACGGKPIQALEWEVDGC